MLYFLGEFLNVHPATKYVRLKCEAILEYQNVMNEKKDIKIKLEWQNSNNQNLKLISDGILYLNKEELKKVYKSKNLFSKLKFVIFLG